MNIKELNAYQLVKSIPEEERELILNNYKQTGGSFSQWREKDWWLMSDALTAEEDRLELIDLPSRNQPKQGVRFLIRGVRRVLENFLDNPSYDWAKSI